MHVKLSRLARAFLCLVTLVASSLALAAVTITQVDVVVGGQHFCDTTINCGTTAGNSNQIWNLNGGITLNPGETLILTQNGTISINGTVVGGNFDTSDRGPQLTPCRVGNPCAVTISLNVNGGGLTQVYSNSAGDPLSAFNAEPDTTPSPSFNEAATWQLAFSNSAYRLDIGYADNEHSAACPLVNGSPLCFPQATWGPGAATYFIGQGLPAPDAACGAPNGHPVAGDGGCYDGGALLITALQPPPPVGNQGCTPGYWKNHTTSWTGFTTSQKVSSVFTGVLSTLANETLLDALQGGGGPGVQGAETILLRAATAALLNAAKGFYPLTTAQVISAVNLALASGNRDTMLALATTLDNDNNLGCPLN